MLDSAFEGSLALYVILLIAGVFFLILWYQRRDRRYLAAAGIAGLLAVLLFLLDRLHETDRERSLRTVQEVTEQINRTDWNGAFRLMADDFEAYNLNKATMREAAERAAKTNNVRNLRVKSMQVKAQDRAKRTVTLRFNVTADSNIGADWAMVACEVDLVHDSRGECRVKSFRIYNPIVDSQDPWNVFQR